MVDPRQLTNQKATDAQLEEILLFSVCVAGKTAHVQAKKLEAFLAPGRALGLDPFAWVRLLDAQGQLEGRLRDVKIGQYQRVMAAFRGLVQLNPRQCTLEELEAVPGIGMKTARMYVLHTRKNQKVAALDTHILRFLRDECGYYTAPKTSPQNPKEYQRWESKFLFQAHLRGVRPEVLDLEVWNAYSRREA